MKTSEWIGVLATGAGPAPHVHLARSLAPVMLGGALFAAVAAIAVLGMVPLAQLVSAAFRMKLGYAALLAGTACWLTARLSRPAAHTRALWWAMAAVVVAMALVGLLRLANTPADERLAQLLGISWMFCPCFVLVLSMPTLAGTLWALRGLAPTQPRQAGFAAGVLAGAVGALGYSMACPEASVTFVAVWYSLGIALTAAVGAVAGPRVLRW